MLCVPVAATRIERECPNRKYVFERTARKRFRPSGSKEYFVANRTECEDKYVAGASHRIVFPLLIFRFASAYIAFSPPPGVWTNTVSCAVQSRTTALRGPVRWVDSPVGRIRNTTRTILVSIIWRTLVYRVKFKSIKKNHEALKEWSKS